DEQPAQDQRDDDPDHQHLLLQTSRHRELRHDEHEDEEVVDGEAVLQRPPGDEVPGVPPSAHGPQQHREEQGEAHIEHDPESRLLGGGDVRAQPDEEQVADQDDREDDHRGDLEPDGDVHGRCAPFARGRE
ncbi:unnamed protein product, partial [Penicillium discolor]